MKSTNKQVFYITTRNSNKKNSELLEKDALIRNLVRGIDYDIVSSEEWEKIKYKYNTEIKTVGVYELWIFFMFNGETSKRLLVHGVEKLFDVIVTLFVNKMIGLEEFYSMFLVSVKGKGRIKDFLLNFNDVYTMYNEKNNIIRLIVKKNKENTEKDSPVLYVEQKNNSKCVGLENLGNTCFMNSAIQCLQNYKKLNEFFIERNEENINGNITKEIVERWIELTKTMSQEKNSCIWGLRKAMGKVNIIYDRNEEQDCHEFINFLLEILHNGTKCINNDKFCKNLKNKCINKELCINEGGWIKKIILPEYKIIGEVRKVYVNNNKSINEGKNNIIVDFNSKGDQNLIITETNFCNTNDNYSTNDNYNKNKNNEKPIISENNTIISENNTIISENNTIISENNTIISENNTSIITNEIINNKISNETYFYKKIKKKTVQEKTRFIVKGDFGELMKHWHNFLMNNNSIIYYNFYGMQLNTLRCTKCNFVKKRFEPFLSLSLPLPPQIIYHSNVIIIFEDMSTIKISVKISMLISEVITFIKNKYHIIGLIVSLGYTKKGEGYVLTGKYIISEYERIILYEYSSINNYFICSFNFKKYLFFSEKFPLEFLVEIEKSHLLSENKFCQISRIFDCGNCDNIQSSDSSIIVENEYLNISYVLSLYKKLLPYLISNTQYECFFGNLKISKPIIHPLLKIPYITVSFKNKNLFLMKKLFNEPKFDPPSLYTLQDCISLYLKQEIIKNTCENCKSSTFKLFPAFVVLPNFLIIHLMRFSYTSSSESKINTFINFPVNSLQIGNAIYKLNSVANHLEIGLGYGHYIAYIRKGNDWYCCNDSVIFKTNVLDKETAYLLFYERIV